MREQDVSLMLFATKVLMHDLAAGSRSVFVRDLRRFGVAMLPSDLSRFTRSARLLLKQITCEACDMQDIRVFARIPGTARLFHIYALGNCLLGIGSIFVLYCSSPH